MSVREGPPPSLRLSPTGFSSHMHPPHGRVDQARGEKQKATKNQKTGGVGIRDLAVQRWRGGWLLLLLPAGMTSPSRQLKWIEHDVIASKSSCGWVGGGDYLYQVFARQSPIEYRGKQSRFLSIILILWIILMY